MVEYALIIALIAVALIGGLVMLSDGLGNSLSTVAVTMDGTSTTDVQEEAPPPEDIICTGQRCR